MKTLAIIFSVSAAGLFATVAVEHASASPAATQNWVRNYVATNAVSTTSSKRAVLTASSASASAISVLQLGGPNVIERACQAATQEARVLVDQLFDNGTNL